MLASDSSRAKAARQNLPPRKRQSRCPASKLRCRTPVDEPEESSAEPVAEGEVAEEAGTETTEPESEPAEGEAEIAGESEAEAVIAEPVEALADGEPSDEEPTEATEA